MTYGLIIYGPKFEWGVGKHVQVIMRAMKQALRWHQQAQIYAPSPKMTFRSENSYQLDLEDRVHRVVQDIIFSYEDMSATAQPSKRIAKAVIEELGLQKYQDHHWCTMACKDPGHCPGNVDLVHWRTPEIPDESTRIHPISQEEADAFMADFRDRRERPQEHR